LAIDLALVTGASGFVGREVVRALLKRGVVVRAGVHKTNDAREFDTIEGVDAKVIDLLDVQSLQTALRSVTEMYHFAAIVNVGRNSRILYQVNVEGTRNLWESASRCGVEKALYCSSASVYGLLSSADQPIAETVRPKAIEPYGRSKLQGEQVALEVGEAQGIATTVIRPAAVFGPRERSAIGGAIRKAALTRVLLPGAYPHKRFSFVHVSDVAEGAIHLMHMHDAAGELYNVCVETPISFEEAFQAYLRALAKSGRALWRPRALAQFSALVQRIPRLSSILSRRGKSWMAFPLWQIAHELTYTSQKLFAAGFRFTWQRFEDILWSCINEKRNLPGAL
jgi:nucleoside-diphosphate-sugar epimerase